MDAFPHHSAGSPAPAQAACKAQGHQCPVRDLVCSSKAMQPSGRRRQEGIGVATAQSAVHNHSAVLRQGTVDSLLVGLRHRRNLHAGEVTVTTHSAQPVSFTQLMGGCRCRASARRARCEDQVLRGHRESGAASNHLQGYVVGRCCDLPVQVPQEGAEEEQPSARVAREQEIARPHLAHAHRPSALHIDGSRGRKAAVFEEQASSS
mmetsp:Transcript_67519/g.135632  ORF Transcript_67519/g.135632 Transcript_67519/m.135632 type:complete len:206 (+) Transcript_67519:244-861(+)